MAKKKSKKSLACYEEEPPPPPFEDPHWPSACEEVAPQQYDEDVPALCDEPPPPELFEQETASEPCVGGLTLVQERPAQPVSPDVTEDERELEREPISVLSEASHEVLEQTWISPYTKSPVPVQFGAEETVYLVPPHFLPPEWLASGARERFEFPDIDSHTGHTIVHYLYKGSYETPPTRDTVTVHEHNGLRAAVLVFIATSSHGLHDLQQLATREIAKHGSSLSLTEFVETIDVEFPRLDPHGWIHEYLRHKTKEVFDRDPSVFSDQAFLQNLGSAALIKFMARCIVDLYSTKIAHMTNTQRHPKGSKDRNEQVASQIEDSPNNARSTSRISIIASECSEEQPCEPRTEAITLSDSSGTMSCSLPKAAPFEIGTCPETTVEDDHEMPDQMAVSTTSEACEVVDEPWPNLEQATAPELVGVSDSTCLVEEDPDESVAMFSDQPAAPSEARSEDIAEAALQVEKREYTPPCHLQAQHVLMGTGWKRCAHCFDVVRGLAGQVS